MKKLKKEILMLFNDNDCNIYDYLSEKFNLTLNKKNNVINFVLHDKSNKYLVGYIIYKDKELFFNFDKNKSLWLKDSDIEKMKVIELLEHLFSFMDVRKVI